MGNIFHFSSHGDGSNTTIPGYQLPFSCRIETKQIIINANLINGTLY